jgi:hypothetical protein
LRYQIFNKPDAAQPRFSVPWLWMARHVCSSVALGWDYCCLVDSRTGQTIREWARAKRPVEWKRPGSGGFATSHIRIDRDGHQHEFLAGMTAYGRGHAPPQGHEPDTVIESEAENEGNGSVRPVKGSTLLPSLEQTSNTQKEDGA